MLAKVLSSALLGVEGFIVDVEVNITKGKFNFEIVGLPDSAIKESKERVEAAIKNSKMLFPYERILVNLAPADMKKEGSVFDLSIAIGILACCNVVEQDIFKDTLFLGELSLNGDIRGVKGVLPMVLSAVKANIKRVIVSEDNAEEAALVSDVEVIGVANLEQLVDFLTGKVNIQPTKVDIEQMFQKNSKYILDFSDVKGQENVKRAMEIAAAGMHNILLVGPPGTGKSMTAKRIPTILPDLTVDESVEITKIYSVAGLLKDKGSLITQRPFRSPHQTISHVAMVGGSRIPQPGEVSLAHNGVLFLDELPQFSKGLLEELRQPLEDAEITISRVNSTITYPANFMLVASMNPCPCGYYGYGKCTCSDNEVMKYKSKVSGPLMDRIDIQIEAANVDYNDLKNETPTESSAQIKQRVIQAQKIQLERYKNSDINFNSQMSVSDIDKYCKLGEKESLMLKNAFEKMNLSARAYHKILKISRTIADLAGKEQISVVHIAEALQLRNFDRSYKI